MFILVFNAVFQAVSYVWNQYFSLINYFGADGLIFQLFIISVVIRFLLKPFFGAASSDIANSNLSKVKKSFEKGKKE